MTPAQIIASKRDGRELSKAQIKSFIEGFAQGTIPDYQMSALAMAVVWRGMTVEEIRDLTATMLDSGDRLKRIPDGPPRVDKHSTGGLGDKVSLVLAPLLACCGVHVPMISGRGLGFSGGTLDKLEAIPGFRVDWSIDETNQLLRDVGCFIIAASPKLAPADRKLYALRDVTGTVESIPLITASILSKKLAASLDALVMDVKVGSAAFMKTPEDARALAASLTSTAASLGLPCTALLTDMYQPLGQAVGNAIEVNEALEVLKGGGPPRVRELTIRLCAEALVAIGKIPDVGIAASELARCLDSGAAYERFMRMVAAQGGQLDETPLPLAECNRLRAKESGWLTRMDGVEIGNLIIELGGGRRFLNDAIDPAVGLEILKRVGEPIEQNEEICRIYADRTKAEPILSRLLQAFEIAPDPTAEIALVLDRYC